MSAYQHPSRIMLADAVRGQSRASASLMLMNPRPDQRRLYDLAAYHLYGLYHLKLILNRTFNVMY
jgi:hypothetical protein